MAEMSVAIMVVSMPALKYLLTYWKKSSGSGSRSTDYYNNSFNEPRVSRRQNQISCNDIGSDVELNRVVREDVIVKTEEVRVDSRPAHGDSYGFEIQAWDSDTRPSKDGSQS